MATRINTNLEALIAQRNLRNVEGDFRRSVERISSGLRINRAADDAAGLTVAEKLRSMVRGLNQATRNAQDGISLIQTGEGAFNEVHAILQRMRELSVQAANDTLTATDRSNINLEVQALVTEIQRISQATKFNTLALLDGTFSDKIFQIGAENIANQQMTVAFGTFDVATLTIDVVCVGTRTNAQLALDYLDAAINRVSVKRSTLGAYQNRLEHTVRNLEVASENQAAAESRIRDADLAKETSDFVRNQIVQQAATAILAQANQAPQLVLSLLR